MNCDKCGNETDVTKTGVGARGHWTMYICQSGCMSDRVGKNGEPYKYGFFPKRGQKSNPGTAAPGTVRDAFIKSEIEDIKRRLSKLELKANDPLEQAMADTVSREPGQEG